MIIIKAGGSAITDKSQQDTPRRDVMEEIAVQLQELDKSVILVHGGGSFGHFPAKKYRIHEGYHSSDQLTGFSHTKEKMEALNNIFIKILNKRVNAVSVQSSACIVTKNNEITRFFSDPIMRILDLGMIPVLYGDTVLDEAMGFCILSGDRIIQKLCSVFPPERVIFGTDVDGIYTKDPKIDENAELIEELSLSEHSAELEDTGDVTGGMSGKLREIEKIVRQGIEVDIINITKKGRILACMSKEFRGTRVGP